MADRRPTPELVEEVQALLARLRPMSKLTARGQGEALTFILKMPVENATLAAWLMAQQARQSGGEDTGSEMDRAQRWIEITLANAISGDWYRLHWLDHPVLFPAPPRPPVEVSGPDPAEDDIPF